jgi:hypothetical protein
MISEAEKKGDIDPFTRSRKKEPIGKECMILSGNSNKELA